MSHSINTLHPGTARSRTPSASERGRGGAGGARDAAPPGGSRPRERPVGTPYREQPDLGQTAIFAAGLAIGAVIGAAAALLTAPQSGVETRLALKRRARQARAEAEDRWDGLGRELRSAARRRKRELRRKIAAGRWRASDAFEG